MVVEHRLLHGHGGGGLVLRRGLGAHGLQRLVDLLDEDRQLLRLHLVMLYMRRDDLHGEREDRLLPSGFSHSIAPSNVVDALMLKALLRKYPALIVAAGRNPTAPVCTGPFQPNNGRFTIG